jgi:hypothetical protein
MRTRGCRNLPPGIPPWKTPSSISRRSPPPNDASLSPNGWPSRFLVNLHHLRAHQPEAFDVLVGLASFYACRPKPARMKLKPKRR